MSTAKASGLANQPAEPGRMMSFLSKVFELNPKGLHWGRGVMFLDVALVPLVVLLASGKEQYLLSAVFGAPSRLWPTLEAPSGTGGGYGDVGQYDAAATSSQISPKTTSPGATSPGLTSPPKQRTARSPPETIFCS